MNAANRKLYSEITVVVIAALFLSSLLFLTSCAVPAGQDQYEANEDEEQAWQELEVGGNSNSDQEESKEEENGQEIDEHKPVPRIGIYSGKGSWDVNVAAFENFFDQYDIDYSSFDEQEAVSLNFSEHYEIILFTGGFAAEYKNYISDHENIRSFVKEGGSFVGTCAGAYYASDILRWQGTEYHYPLGFFDGRGIGPLSGQIGWGETGTFNLDSNHPANESFGQSLDFYYFDGPYFEPYDDQHKIEILARYAVNDQPAVIAGRYGEGKYLLYGPHPEIGGYSADSPDYNLDGEEGAKWPWLYSTLHWFSSW